ncbi:MAG TPA: UDP-3-O-acyl-N-acetylglucosamine deacetylase [Gemmataceae bacterium]|nr:UDP-3-O-acyl-N-acetylglucosamine deacetylase [Gemmataceae bacterium]
MRRYSYRYQRTIARPVELIGVGFLTGASVRLCFRPAPPSTGVVFVRTDLRPSVQIPARVEQVTGTQRRTTLGHPPAQVALVEHVLAALAGLRIDNCYVELNAPEPPGLDGSAQRFVEALWRAGVVLQPARRTILCVDASVVVSQGGATLALYPPFRDELKISYALDYGMTAPIDRQLYTQVVTPQSFTNELAGCRTFLLESEAVEFRRQGLGARTTAADLLIFGRSGPINNSLRCANEPARHKILDMVGDLSLLGADLRGHLVAYRSGHPLNVELVRVLTGQMANGACPCSAQRLAA